MHEDDFLGRDDDEMEELLERQMQQNQELNAGTDGNSVKRGWLTETKTNARWYCVLNGTSLQLFETEDASGEPQRTIALTVCASVRLGGLLQHTLNLNSDGDTKVLSLFSDFATSMELRSHDVHDCNAWYNAMNRIIDETRQSELEAMAEIDDKDMKMRFRHARLWALEKVSAPQALPRNQWTISAAVTHCTYCEGEFANDFAKHHCRLCGEVYCASHSKVGKDLEFSEKPFRVCVWCHLIWRDYAQGVMDGMSNALDLLGDNESFDCNEELEALRDYRRNKAKERQAVAVAAAGAARSPGRRLSMGLSSLVTKFSGMFSNSGANSPSTRSLLATPRAARIDEEDEEDEVLEAVTRGDHEDDVARHRGSTAQQLEVLGNLLTVSTSNSEWMKHAEETLQHEEENYLDLTYAGWLMKRGKLGRDMKTSRPRYFVLKRGALKYYEHEKDLSQEIGRVQLSYSTQIKVHPDHPRMLEICPGDNFVVAAEARTDAEAQEWKSKLREVIDAMRLAFMTQTMHDEAYAATLARARESFESGQLHALYEKNSQELQPLKSGFACFKCARSFARMETSKVHCRSCGRLFCGLCASMQPIPPLCGGMGRPEGAVAFMEGSIPDGAQDLLESKYGFLFPPSDDALAKLFGGSKKVHFRRLCWACTFIFTSFPIVLYLEGKEKQVQEQQEKERAKASEAIAGQELLSEQIRELSQSIKDNEAVVAKRQGAQREEKATLVAHAQKLKAEVKKRGLQLNKLAVAYQELSGKQAALEAARDEALEEASELREQLATYEQNLRHAHGQIQDLTRRYQQATMELEKAKVGIVTMQQHMKSMKMNMGQLQHKMDQAERETERQMREKQKLESAMLAQEQLANGGDVEATDAHRSEPGDGDTRNADSGAGNANEVEDDDDWGAGMTATSLEGKSRGMDLPTYGRAAERRNGVGINESAYAYQQYDPEVLAFKKKVIRFFSEYAPEKLQENMFVERTLLKHRGHEKVLVEMLRQRYENGDKGVNKYGLDRDIPTSQGDGDVAQPNATPQGTGSTAVPKEAEDDSALSVNEEAMLLAQMQAIQAMQALTRWRIHDCSAYAINPKCDRIDAPGMKKLLDSWTQFKEQREKLQRWAYGICTGSMFRDLDFARRVDLQKVHSDYAEAILKLLVPVVQKSAPDEIKVHIRLTPGQENGKIKVNQTIPDHPLKTKAPVDIRLQLKGE